MKGISAVLATVLIVVITVAIIGLAYGWATGLFGVVTTASTGSTQTTVSNIQKQVQIVAAGCDDKTQLIAGREGEVNYNELYFTVKSTGSAAIGVGELNAYLNNNKISSTVFIPADDDNDIEEASLAVGEVRQFIYQTADRSSSSATYILKVDAPAGYAEWTVSCPYLPLEIGGPQYNPCDGDGECEPLRGETCELCPDDNCCGGIPVGGT